MIETPPKLCEFISKSKKLCGIDYKVHKRCKYCTRLDHYCQGQCLENIKKDIKFECRWCGMILGKSKNDDQNYIRKGQRGNICSACNVKFANNVFSK